MTHARALLFALVLVVATLAPASLATAQSPGVYQADRGHGLVNNSSIESFHDSGVATGGVDGLNMSLTVADEAGDAGLTELAWRSTGRVFLRVDYNEGIERTVRFYIPDDYVAPQLQQGLGAAHADVTADLEPVAERNFTAVTVTLDEPTEAVFPISVSRGMIAEGRSGISGLVQNVTGVELPSLTDSGAEWQYLAQSDLADDTDDSIPSNATTIQYDAATTNGTVAEGERDWVPVPSCDGASTPVCTYEKTGQANRTYLLSTTSDPPMVRYREGDSVSGSLGAAVNDALQGVDDLMADVEGLFHDDAEDEDDGGIWP